MLACTTVTFQDMTLVCALHLLMSQYNVKQGFSAGWKAFVEMQPHFLPFGEF